MSRRPLPDYLQVPWSVFDALVVFVMAWLGAPIAFVLLVRQLMPYSHLATQFIDGLRTQDIMVSFVLALISALMGLGIVGLYLRRYHVGWRSVGWRRFSLGRAIGLIAGIFVGFLALVSLAFYLVTLLLPSFNANQAQVNEFTGQAAQHHTGLAIIALVVLPPILEETIFRGFIFPALSKRWGAIVGAILTSLLFGLAHLQANISLYTFILSMLLCLMYYRLKSIFPGMILHMINNYLAYIAITSK